MNTTTRWSCCVIVLPISCSWSSSYAQPGSPPIGFVQASNTPCKVGRPNVKAREGVTWSGQCADGLASGPGTAQWVEDGKPTLRYEGIFASGLLEGKGKMTGADGDRYEGDYKGGLRHGHGVYVSGVGERFEGQYLNNQRLVAASPSPAANLPTTQGQTAQIMAPVPTSQSANTAIPSVQFSLNGFYTGMHKLKLDEQRARLVADGIVEIIKPYNPAPAAGGVVDNSLLGNLRVDVDFLQQNTVYHLRGRNRSNGYRDPQVDGFNTDRTLLVTADNDVWLILRSEAWSANAGPEKSVFMQSAASKFKVPVDSFSEDSMGFSASIYILRDGTIVGSNSPQVRGCFSNSRAGKISWNDEPYSKQLIFNNASVLSLSPNTASPTCKQQFNINARVVNNRIAWYEASVVDYSIMYGKYDSSVLQPQKVQIQRQIQSSPKAKF
jgi:hypothetical protein